MKNPNLSVLFLGTLGFEDENISQTCLSKPQLAANNTTPLSSRVFNRYLPFEVFGIQGKKRKSNNEIKPAPGTQRFFCYLEWMNIYVFMATQMTSD